MVSETYKPTRKEKDSRVTNKIQAEDLKRLQKSMEEKSTDPTTRLQKTLGIMANCNPVVPVMDWTEDAELHKKYVEWKEEVELELGSSLSNRFNSVKSNNVLRWAGEPARDYVKVYQNQSSNMKGHMQMPY